jgi:Transposase DDE domain group 1
VLGDGGDCLSDLRAVRDQQPLFGPVASDSPAFRLIGRIGMSPGLLDALRAARARTRPRVWELGVRPERIVIDIDVSLLNAHTEKEGAAVNFKSGFGFHPILAISMTPTNHSRACCGRAGRLRTLRKRSLTCSTSRSHRSRRTWLVISTTRSWCGSIRLAPHPRCAGAAQEAGIGFLVGFDLFAGVREAILSLPENAWRPAIRQNGEERDGAQVAEITHVERLDLTPCPDGSRVIIRRERPHPGAQLKFTDHEGHRFPATLTDLTGDIVEIERLHRPRANVEDRIRAAKQGGLENLPFQAFALNAFWLELSLIARPSSPGPGPCAWRASSRSAIRRRCVTGCCPDVSRSMPAVPFCASSTTGHRPNHSPPRSSDSDRCHNPPADRAGPTVTPDISFSAPPVAKTQGASDAGLVATRRSPRLSSNPAGQRHRRPQPMSPTSHRRRAARSGA